MADNTPSRTLLVIAAPAELAAVRRGIGADSADTPEWELCELVPGVDAILTGIGKSNAAGAVSRLAQKHHRTIMSIGIAGVLSPRPFVAGERFLASKSVFADEGVDAGESFLTTAEIGFPMAGVDPFSLLVPTHLRESLSGLVHSIGVIATVSTCSGTNLRATQIQQRTGADCEAMEGAAVGLVAHRLAANFAEVRVISNSTGERARQQWDIRTAFESLSEFSRLLAMQVSAINSLSH